MIMFDRMQKKYECYRRASLRARGKINICLNIPVTNIYPCKNQLLQDERLKQTRRLFQVTINTHSSRLSWTKGALRQHFFFFQSHHHRETETRRLSRDRKSHWSKAKVEAVAIGKRL